MTREYIPNNLKFFRKRAGLRQQDLPAKLDFIAFDRISKWEKGLAYPSLEMLAKMMSLFNVQPIDLYPELFQNNDPSLPVHPTTQASQAASQSGVVEYRQMLHGT